jgi:hypothetical protein
MRGKAKGFFAITVFVLGALFPFVADGAVISVDSVNAAPGTSFTLGVRLSNNTNTISALTVPLEFSSQYLNVDSVSFANSILPAAFRGVADINNTNNTVRISYIPNQFTSPIPTLNTDQGLIGTIHFSLAQGASAGNVPIDSLYRDSVVNLGGNDIHFWVRVELSNQSGTVLYLPGFSAGAVNVTFSTDIKDNNDGLLPNRFDLAQNYPNPFNPATTIEYALAKAGHVSLKVYNVIGQEVAALIDEHKGAGVYSISFEAGNFPSGVYL